LKTILNLEKDVNELKKKFFNKSLVLSKKRGFKMVLTPGNIEHFDGPKQTLLIKKKKNEL